MSRIDHLVVPAADLAAGCAHVAACLGLDAAAFGPVGTHPRMGTHNRLLSLGPEVYLEVIAIDPQAAAPEGPRWFGLDDLEGPPRLGAWVLRDPLARPREAGDWREMTRGPYAWRICLPEAGGPARHGLFPALIEWQAGERSAGPAPDLPDHGLRLTALELSYPDLAALEGMLMPLGPVPLLETRGGPTGLRARIKTPAGERVLA